MPNRIIKESAFLSDRIAQLTDFEFRLWTGLITQADDLGRGDARPAIIKGRVFALRECTTVKDIENALSALATHGCISLYTVGGKPYYEFPHWAEHQRVRDVKSKYPGSEDADELPQVTASCGGMPQDAASCGEMPQDAAERGVKPPESESETNPNPIQSESDSNAHVCETAFDRFWSAYPKRVGIEAARVAFDKVKVPIDSLLAAIEQQKKSSQWRKENGRFIPNPATWLNQGRWQDEVQIALPKGAPEMENEKQAEKIARMRKMVTHLEGVRPS